VQTTRVSALAFVRRCERLIGVDARRCLAEVFAEVLLEFERIPVLVVLVARLGKVVAFSFAFIRYVQIDGGRDRECVHATSGALELVPLASNLQAFVSTVGEEDPSRQPTGLGGWFCAYYKSIRFCCMI